MAAVGQEKRPTETIRLSADFAGSLLSGENVLEQNCFVKVTNAFTDEDVTPEILAAGSLELVGTVLRARFKGGEHGSTYEVVFSSGETNFQNSYDGTVNLIVTKYPSGDNLYTTLDDVKTRLSITDASEDKLLTSLILSGSRYLRNRFGRELLFRQHAQRIYLMRPGREVRLHEYPIRKIDSITLVWADETMKETVTPETCWDFTDDGALFLRHSFVFLAAPNFNDIVYRAGFDAVPEDVGEAAAKAAMGLYRVLGQEGLSEERIGDYTYRARSLNDLPKNIRAELADEFIEAVVGRYRRYDLTDDQPTPMDALLGPGYLR